MATYKLSSVNPLLALTLSNAKLIDYVFEPKRVEIVDSENYNIGLVLGCSDYEIMKHRADTAINLYKNGIVGKLCLTGGIGFLSKNREDSEASVMKKYMLEQGVSEASIIVEDKSRSTFENMKNSLSYIEKECNADGKIVIITSDFHCKRAKGMLKKMTDYEIYSYGVLDGKHDIDKFASRFSTRKVIMQEAVSISLCTLRGVMADREIVKVNVKTREQIV